MKRLLWAAFLLLIAITFADAQTQQPPRFAYVVNTGSSDISGYTIDATTGALTPVPGSPFPTGFSPEAVVVDPSGRFAYTPNLAPGFVFNGSISAFTIDAAIGSLTNIVGSPFPVVAGTGAFSVTIHP